MDIEQKVIKQIFEDLKQYHQERGELTGIHNTNEILVSNETYSGHLQFSFHPLQPITAPYSEQELSAFAHDYVDDVKTNGFPAPEENVNRIPGTQAHGFKSLFNPVKGPPYLKFFDMPYPNNDKYIPNGTKHGWMLQDLIRKESQINGRWLYWREVEANQSFNGIPSPRKLNFDSTEDTVLGMLETCLTNITDLWDDHPEERWAGIRYLFDWILWSLGHRCCPDFPQEENYKPVGSTAWDGNAHNRLFQIFNLNPLLLFPDDYFGLMLHNLSDETHTYPKPLSFRKINTWVKKEFGRNGSIKHTDLFVDPCTDSGRVIMSAGNYTYQLLGFYEDELLAKAALINFYLYVPWAIRSLPWLKEKHETVDYDRAKVIARKIATLYGTSFSLKVETHKLTSETNFLPLFQWKVEEIDVPQLTQAQKMFQSLGGSKETKALSPADEMFQALGGSKETKALSPADEMFQALGGSKETKALSPADEMFQSLGGSKETKALNPADEMFKKLGGKKKPKQLSGGSDG